MRALERASGRPVKIRYLDGPGEGLDGFVLDGSPTQALALGDYLVQRNKESPSVTGIAAEAGAADMLLHCLRLCNVHLDRYKYSGLPKLLRCLLIHSLQ